MTYLVICIDRDDDIGIKAEIQSPVIGREANLNAVIKLALVDPEDSDVNVIFEGIKLYDSMKEEGKQVEIVTITGHMKVGLKSDQKIGADLEKVLDIVPGERAIVISDGEEDELVIPLIQSRIKVDAIKRVVVKQSRNLESTYYLIKNLFNDPKIARTFLIPLGVVFLIYSLSLFFNRPEGTVIGITVFIGLYLLYKGFQLDEYLKDFTTSVQTSFYEGKITFITYMASLILGGVGIIQGALNIWTFSRNPILPGFLPQSMIFINGSIWWFVSAGLLSGFGKILNTYIEKEEAWRHWSLPFFIFATGIIFWGGSSYILAYMKFGEIDINLGTKYLVISLVSGVLIALLGVWVSNLLKKFMTKLVE